MFNKPAIVINDQINQLKGRGLTIADYTEAYHYLSHVSYYRLAGYWWPMQSDKINHIFKAGSDFKSVIALYNFDRNLRSLIFDAIEKIEISLRTKLIYHISHEVNPWWFQDLSIFEDSTEAVKTLSTISGEIQRSKKTFITAHRTNYPSDLRFPPAWKSLELTSFGSLSKLYGNLKGKIKSKDVIAVEYGVINHTYLKSWLQSITQIRNICAHHSRLWNRRIPTKPKLFKTAPLPWLTTNPPDNELNLLYIHLCCIRYLLNSIAAQNNFSVDLQNLLNNVSSG